jgi:serine/threonine-protein kinase
MPLAAGTTIGPYEITGWIGAGGMGEVYRARDPRLGRDVAIKVIAEGFAADAGRVQRFEQEARAAGQLNHPNILAVYDVGASDGRHFIVSELLDGESLRARLRTGPLPLRKAIDCARQVAEGLAAAHDKAIVHRDLKPDNVFITRDGRAKILDFGLAKLTQPNDQPTSTNLGQDTEPGTILGTPGYMSPEQVRGEVLDARSDLFSFGTILCEMITGRSPFARPTPVETMAAILGDDPGPELSRAAPPGVERVIARCLEKTREARFQSARDLAFGLEFLADGSRTGERASFGPWRSWWWLPLAAAVITVVVVGAALVLAPGFRREPPPALPLRLSVELGAGTPLPRVSSQFGDVMALSPDGSLVAFAAQKAADNATQVIYVRSLGDLQARMLTGTDGGAQPFFSPDARWIGFFAGGKLMKVPVEGGPPVALADASDPRGGSWGADGHIVYTPDRYAGTPLWRVPADGGTAQPLTTIGDGTSIHVFPQVVGGARAVLYTSTATPGSYNNSSIVVQPLPSGTPKVIHHGGYHARITASGHLVFIHNGTLMAAPIDLDRFDVLRPPAPIVVGLRSNAITGGSQFTVSDSGLLAYMPGDSIGGSTPMQLMDRQSAYTRLNADFGNWLDVRFSPDGGRVAMSVRDREADIWIFDLARETLSRLTTDSAVHAKPVWSPDGQRVVFAASRDGQPMNLAWRAADGSGATQRLVASTRNQAPSAFHPGGRFLAVEEFEAETNIDLKVLPIEGGEGAPAFGTPLTVAAGPHREFDAAFSPDGAWIAFASDETGRGEVYVMPFPALDRRWMVSNGGGRAPAWSRTRPEILFLQSDQLAAVDYTVAGGVFRAGPSRRWAEGRVAFRGPSRIFDLHPDGNRVVLAPAPSPRDADALRQDKMVLVLNFFDELRRIAPR